MQVSPDQLHAVAVEAGAAILAVYHRAGAVAVEYKPDASPLTEADRAAHDPPDSRPGLVGEQRRPQLL